MSTRIFIFNTIQAMSGNKLNSLVNDLCEVRRDELATRVFSKALYAFVLVKVIALYAALSQTALASSEIPDSILHRVFFFSGTCG